MTGLNLDVQLLVAAALFGAAATAAASAIWRPAPRLAARLRPYNSANRVRLGQPADIGGEPTAAARAGGAWTAVFRPMLLGLATTLGRLVDHESDEQLLRRLRQAGAYPDLTDQERLLAYRKRRLGLVALALAVACPPALSLGSALWLVVMLSAGLTVGLTWPRYELDRAIKTRSYHMRIDLYTVNQHLAQLLDTGRGVDEALQRLTQRARGPVIDELTQALVWRRAGRLLPDALRALAERTPEPHAARTYQALAKAVASGATVTDSLRALAEDVRSDRREALQRTATKRRTASFVPMMLLCFPTLVMLVVAPMLSVQLAP